MLHDFVAVQPAWRTEGFLDGRIPCLAVDMFHMIRRVMLRCRTNLSFQQEAWCNVVDFWCCDAVRPCRVRERMSAAHPTCSVAMSDWPSRTALQCCRLVGGMLVATVSMCLAAMPYGLVFLMREACYTGVFASRVLELLWL